ncbi:CMP-2-keto-3-deoxyoctulosonic acid synthetase [Paramagnetospirillum caucaseum]|uniref:CMP-2-keto-3-deoxyoctulosonic acid synthetase n=1 Tax=Paramagnetospirillum caucaseum TaxID=1244869 RepID=M3ACK2_9PROT|nr:3-deoxy-manno-octulosonate cytidylyltransferase [Paramagnetospirillum caucaseum]EME70528.1 CMP-2-keto-3-deoxyoctulosonic acid synthetase [Paramagnetospirillum caucaseum]
MTKIIGLIPARMAASRFPGKPLFPIMGRPMIEHVFERAKLFPRFDVLAICTCDEEIRAFAESKGYPVIMTSDSHTRALDRVAEAATKCGIEVADDDIVLNVQGDEPMMHPDMIKATIAPMEERPGEVRGTMLAMDIVDEAQFRNPDALKIISDLSGRVLYTSRQPIPHCKSFGPDLGARRIYGIFGFKWEFLKLFTNLPPSPLEIKEACDSNRLYDHGFHQHIAPYPFRPSYSVDSPHDIGIVEAAMQDDVLWGKY